MKWILKVKNKNNFDLVVGVISGRSFIKVRSLLNEEQTEELIEEFPDIIIIGRGNVGPNEVVEFETEQAVKVFQKIFHNKYEMIETEIEEVNR